MVILAIDPIVQDLERYNVVWDTPSKDASGSMPLGNGYIGLNVWVEESTGDVMLLLAKSDAWDENSINLKLGRIRLKISPGSLTPFRQTLRLRTGQIEIQRGGVSVRIVVDANQPLIVIDAESGQPFEIRASLEMWRTHEYTTKTQTGDLFRDLGGKDPYPTIISPDYLLADSGDQIIWCHRNAPRENDGFAINMKLQGLGDFIDQMRHPLLGRTFGAAMGGEGFKRVEPMTLQSPTAMQHRLSIKALTFVPPWTLERCWDDLAEEISHTDRHRREHQQWWDEFWNRSWIETSDFHVTRGYVLQRFMNACAGRGDSPIKFNGSLFSVGKPEDPDFRRWGGPGFWFMNLRLIYWPMIACGDWDLIHPWLRMYLDMLPLQRHRTQKYFGHGGAHYPETIQFWGAEVSAHYGWTPFEQRSTPEAECAYVRYYWSCGIELSLILWTRYVHTQEKNFARTFLIPIADAITEFYDLHYPRDERGKIRFEPAQALETWHEASNPLPEIAGLRYLLPKLLELPENLTTETMRSRWRRMIDELPPIPIGEKDGRRVILPADRVDKKKNTENPELYGVFPYRLFGVGKPDLDLARDTFAARLHREHDCWSQDEIQMALLGLADQAKDYLVQRASDASHSDSRFPAFWNAFHDWIPDMDHGGVLQLALQFMLMQCEGREIRLLPAWPKEWDASFKLHAPYQTIVEGAVKGGKLVNLRVTPESRRADVVVENA